MRPENFTAILIYEEEARGAFFRSRRKWPEQGEKCSK